MEKEVSVLAAAIFASEEEILLLFALQHFYYESGTQTVFVIRITFPLVSLLFVCRRYFPQLPKSVGSAMMVV